MLTLFTNKWVGENPLILMQANPLGPSPFTKLVKVYLTESGQSFGSSLAPARVHTLSLSSRYITSLSTKIYYCKSTAISVASINNKNFA